MQHATALAALALWGPIVLGLAWRLGAARGALIGLLAGFLLLPRSPMAGWSAFGLLTLDKRTIPGLAALAAVALFDRRAFLRFRPSAVDLGALAFVLAPLVASAGRGFDSPRGSVDQSWIHLAEWGLPYLLGRIYFAGGDGPRRLGTAVAVAGLLYIPVVAFEATLGPGWYLAGRLYGIKNFEMMNARLGGWRPETLVSNGLELAEWMGLAATLATWMWACAGWRPGPIPRWLPAPALILASLGTRGVYGYAVLALGLAATAATRLLRVRLFLMALTLVPPAYLAARISGLWDGQAMVRLAERAGRRGTVDVRVLFEESGIAKAKAAGLMFGEGGRYPDWWADGRWVATLRGSGLAGVAAQYAALLGPAALLIWRRKGAPAATSPEMGLALFVVLHAVDGLQNTALIVPVPVLCGALAGVLAARDAPPDGARRRPRSAGAGHATYRLGEVGVAPVDRTEGLAPVGAVLAIACLLYVFGHAPARGQDAARFVGGLGAALLFAASGAAAASVAPRHDPARVAAFALAFAALGVSLNLGLHPSERPVWSSDILQGMALSGLAVALAPARGVGASAVPIAALAAGGAAWWAFGGAWRPFPGSQYLFDSGDPAASPFPVAPWVTLAALGAGLAGASTRARLATAAGLGLASAMAWRWAWPMGPPSKVPLNVTYALLGGSAASAAFAASGPIRRWPPARAASDWLGRRWLLFFYLNLGVAGLVGRAGLTGPAACWAATAAATLAATWLVSAVGDRLGAVTRSPWAWAALGSATLGVGLAPGVPPSAVRWVAGGAGLVFAARWGDLAALILGPRVAAPGPLEAPAVGDRARYLARLALLALALAGPELARRLPPLSGPGAGPADGAAPAGPTTNPADGPHS